MWKSVNSATKPAEIDTDSSRVYNYVRRNIVAHENEENEISYDYEELKVPKEAWDLYLANVELEATLDDLLTNVIPEVLG